MGKPEFDNCPFCGGNVSTNEVRKGTDNRDDTFYITFRVYCTGCGVFSRQYTQEYKFKNGEMVTVHDAYKEAVKDWNRRANVKEVQGEYEIYKTLPCKIGDTVFVYANNRAEETKVKSFTVYHDQILVGTTIGEFDANRVYKDIVELYQKSAEKQVLDKEVTP